MPDGLAHIADELARSVSGLRFGPPVTHVYNPLEYAREPHHRYLRRYGTGPKEVLLVGMNPGPWGMAQTGVPFGEVSSVRDWLGIDGRVERPDPEHPKRPVEGFACTRREVSGSRLWGCAREHFGDPDRFFRRFFVWNYCPLVFLESTGRNLTPDRLPRVECRELLAACDRALLGVVDHLRPRLAVGIGRFAERRLLESLSERPVRIGGILHPSPASPAANRGWSEQAREQLRALGACDGPGDATG